MKGYMSPSKSTHSAMEGGNYGSTPVEYFAGSSSSSRNVPQHHNRVLKQDSFVDLSLCDQETMASFYDWYMMYRYKVEVCKNTKDHESRYCHYKHPGKEDGRRNLQRVTYEATLCSHGVKYCIRGDSCGFSHGELERKLHPSTYHTSMCNPRGHCKVKPCFCAHRNEELRPPSHVLAPHLITTRTENRTTTELHPNPNRTTRFEFRPHSNRTTSQLYPPFNQPTTGRIGSPINEAEELAYDVAMKGMDP